MDTDYAPVTSPDEDEEERKYPYPPAMAAPAAPPAMPSPDPGSPMSAMTGPSAAAPPVIATGAPQMPTLGAQRPQWKDYAPADPHGWSKFGHAMAALSPISDRIVNQRPEQRAEKAYGAATQEFNQGQAEDLKNKEEQRAETTAQQEGPLREAQTREANVNADVKENPPDKAAKDPFALWMDQNPNHPVTQYFRAQQDAKQDKPENDFEQF